MGLGKWIGGALGFMTMGPLGALAGYFVGSWFEKVTENSEKVNEEYRQQRTAEGQRNSFFFSMMVLTSYIIRLKMLFAYSASA